MIVLTRAINAYDQDGDYFVAAWCKRPSEGDIATCLFNKPLFKVTTKEYELIKHILRGGGRRYPEDIWYLLTDVEEGENYEKI